MGLKQKPSQEALDNARFFLALYRKKLLRETVK